MHPYISEIIYPYGLSRIVMRICMKNLTKYYLSFPCYFLNSGNDFRNAFLYVRRYFSYFVNLIDIFPYIG